MAQRTCPDNLWWHPLCTGAIWVTPSPGRKTAGHCLKRISLVTPWPTVLSALFLSQSVDGRFQGPVWEGWSSHWTWWTMYPASKSLNFIMCGTKSTDSNLRAGEDRAVGHFSIFMESKSFCTCRSVSQWFGTTKRTLFSADGYNSSTCSSHCSLFKCEHLQIKWECIKI